MQPFQPILPCLVQRVGRTHHQLWAVGKACPLPHLHKIANVLDVVPSSLQPKVKAALHTIMNAENKEAADLAIDQFEATYGAKYPKAVDKVLRDREVLLAHFVSVEHWIN